MDPVTLSVIRGAFAQVADEMDKQLIRAAISPIISEMNDCGHGIFTPDTGETIAQGQFGLPLFFVNMQLTVQRIIDLARAGGGFQPGDVWIVNDPYFSGTHLNDVCLVAPYFFEGELVALTASTGHWLDIGGSQPGGWVPSATNIHQEGLRIPPVKLISKGERNVALIETIMANLRLPQEVGGDLSAMIGVLVKAADRLEDIFRRHGRDTVRTCVAELMARAEREMRAHVEALPDGDYAFEDFLDNDGLVDEPIRFKVTARIRGSSLTFDFSGTSDSAKGPMNLARTTTMTTCYVTFKHIFPDVSVNGGTFRPVSFEIPENSCLSAKYPQPIGGYLEMVGRVIDLVFGCMVKVVPERVPAAFFGTTGVMTLSGSDPKSGRYAVSAWPYAGGYGASHASDGLLHGTSPVSMAMLMSLELSEHRFPIMFENFAARPDSGGPGWHRGGCGSTFTIRALDTLDISILGDRVDHVPFGVEGGGAAAGNAILVETQGRQWVPPMRSKLQGLVLDAGDRITLSSPGGGGYGDPLTRDPDLVLGDVRNGFLSPEGARRNYGVVIGPGAQDAADSCVVDVAATAELREALSGSKQTIAEGM